MAYQFYIEPTLNCVFVRHYEVFHIDDTLSQYREMVSHPAYDKNMNVLRDVTETTLPPEFGFKFFSEETPVRYKEFEITVGSSKVAWVLGSGKDYAILHQFTLTARFKPLNHITRKPFRTIEKAKNWLDIPLEYNIDFASTGVEIRQSS